jgi:hypothetical protein
MTTENDTLENNSIRIGVENGTIGNKLFTAVLILTEHQNWTWTVGNRRIKTGNNWLSIGQETLKLKFKLMN